MKRSLLLYEILTNTKDVKHSKYESKIKWTPTHVQVMENMRQTPV